MIKFERVYKSKTKRIEPNTKQKTYLRSLDYREYGENFNGYGYKDKVRVFTLTPYQVKKYNELKDYEPPRELTQEEREQKWINRLVKLTGISEDEATEIMEEKKEYHEDKIENLWERQYNNSSNAREKLIEKLQRTNPLRYIKDSEHAGNILGASARHNETNYEAKLEEGRDLRAIGEIEDVHEYARNNARAYV